MNQKSLYCEHIDCGKKIVVHVLRNRYVCYECYVKMLNYDERFKIHLKNRCDRMKTQKSTIEIVLNTSQQQVIINAWRMLDFTAFFMITTCVEPFITDDEALSEISFLVSVMYQRTHAIHK